MKICLKLRPLNSKSISVLLCVMYDYCSSEHLKLFCGNGAKLKVEIWLWPFYHKINRGPPVVMVNTCEVSSNKETELLCWNGTMLKVTIWGRWWLILILGLKGQTFKVWSWSILLYVKRKWSYLAERVQSFNSQCDFDLLTQNRYMSSSGYVQHVWSTLYLIMQYVKRKWSGNHFPTDKQPPENKFV